MDQYVGTTRKAWNGRALVVIRSTKADGDINLKVSSPGLIDAIVTIRSVIVNQVR
jgi:beta-galactosidase